MTLNTNNISIWKLLMEVKVHDEIWLIEKWFDRYGGWEHVEIVMIEKQLAEEAEKDGWTVTHYVREES